MYKNAMEGSAKMFRKSKPKNNRKMSTKLFMIQPSFYSSQI